MAQPQQPPPVRHVAPRVRPEFVQAEEEEDEQVAEP